MKKHITLMVLLLALAIILSLTACSQASGQSATTVTIKDQDAGKSIDIKTGQVLEVVLEGNPTTGFTWENTPADTSVLKQNGEADFKADTNAVGSGGMITLHFDAVAPGQANLKLVYHRPWEKDVAPIKTYQVTVNVK